MLPILVNMKDRLAVVVGAGPVGQRKASAVLAAGGRVRLICLEPCPVEMSDPRLEWHTGAYGSEQLDGASLVFAAGPPDVNAQVVADARSRGLWVNAASDPLTGDFFLPATIRRGDFLIAVSSGGAAPMLSQVVRTRLETEFDNTFGVWVSLLTEMRPLVMDLIPDPERRQTVWTILCQWQWLERLRVEDVQAVRVAMYAAITATTSKQQPGTSPPSPPNIPSSGWASNQSD